MKQKIEMRDRWMQLIAVLCLMLALLTGCQKDNGAMPEPPADTPGVQEPEPPKEDQPEEPEPPASSPAESEPDEKEPEEEEKFLTYKLKDFESTSALCNGKKGELVVAEMQVKNETDVTFHLHQTLLSVGNVTDKNLEDGMSADAIFAGKPAEQLSAQVKTDRKTETTKSVIAAVDGPSEEIRAGQTATVYLYVFVPEEEGTWKKITLQNGGSDIGYLS